MNKITIDLLRLNNTKTLDLDEILIQTEQSQICCCRFFLTFKTSILCTSWVQRIDIFWWTKQIHVTQNDRLISKFIKWVILVSQSFLLSIQKIVHWFVSVVIFLNCGEKVRDRATFKSSHTNSHKSPKCKSTRHLMWILKLNNRLDSRVNQYLDRKQNTHHWKILITGDRSHTQKRNVLKNWFYNLNNNLQLYDCKFMEYLPTFIMTNGWLSVSFSCRCPPKCANHVHSYPWFMKRFRCWSPVDWLKRNDKENLFRVGL